MNEEFKYHKLRKLQPQGLIDKDTTPRELSLEGLFLSLALIFNDIKGLALMEECRDKVYRKPVDEEDSGHAGEWWGLKYQIIKYFSSILYETIELIMKNKKVIKSAEFKKYSLSLSEQNQKIWSLLLDIADIEKSINFSDEKINRFKKLLSMIRHKMAFHYDQSAIHLIEGYRRHFYHTHIGNATKFAYYSSQISDPFRSRYYYADAALMGFLYKEMDSMGDVGEVFDAIYNTAVEVSLVIMGLLEEYHKHKPMA